jgi:uracil-DNA glycosylase
MTDAFDALVREVLACTICARHLPNPPRPVLMPKAGARVLIVGQAPGTRVHATGLPWNDASGDRLRAWLAVPRETFYGSPRVAIVPMGFCYPGRDARGADRPPRPECAPAWHPRLLPLMPEVESILLVGAYAQARYLAERRKGTLTATVGAWREYAPRHWPLPHPSWRTRRWESLNPWFQAELIPELRRRLRAILGPG